MAHEAAKPEAGARVRKALMLRTPDDLPCIARTGGRLVLLDIEGTTCPIDFVTGTLFPYAVKAMDGFLLREAPRRQDVQQLLEAVRQAWRNDEAPAATALRRQSNQDIGAYLHYLIHQDSKLPALKDLQGLVWHAGYMSGELIAPLFPDVADALQCWKDLGVGRAVYSSGSVAAQQLLYSHSSAGDLSQLFEHWFDTRVGPKQEHASYTGIASVLKLRPAEILFISDSPAECEAAENSGMMVLFSEREGNTHTNPGCFTSISDFRQLAIKP
ncbi:MAG: acireductone synthase [Synechococcaceae cyanobacterium]